MWLSMFELVLELCSWMSLNCVFYKMYKTCTVTVQANIVTARIVTARIITAQIVIAQIVTVQIGPVRIVTVQIRYITKM